VQYEREAALRDFSSGTVRVLIATDVASRGLDVKGIGHVINMDLPRAFEDYVHRIGELACTQCARPAQAVLAWLGVTVSSRPGLGIAIK
jgi:superfamily II DNA/RNA helicase